MKILFIDDMQDSVADASDLITQELENSLVGFVEFGDAEGKLRDFQPHIVVLDLSGGQPHDHHEGFGVHDYIWDNRFCPVIVYSAYVQAYKDEYGEDHPLIKCVEKGSESPQMVLREIKDLVPLVDALKKTEEQVNLQFSKSLREVAPIAAKTLSDATLAEVLVRAGRRRVAAMMDEPLVQGEKLASWEHYLWPPVSENVLLADVLMTKDADKDDPKSFRIVLTPSCDMVQTGGRDPKVDKVLVAKCYSMPEAQELVGLKGARVSRLKDRMLNQGYAQAIIPLPKLEGLIPTMAANLHSLELIDIQEVGTGEGRKYQRVASCDSPFRELVAWAYIQNAGRPGLPERDLDTWATEIHECR